MKKTRLTPETLFEEWRSTENDLRGMKPLAASRMLFDIVLIHEFEHALLHLKSDNCLWAPCIPASDRRGSRRE
jgi:hypothetical protein